MRLNVWGSARSAAAMRRSIHRTWVNLQHYVQVGDPSARMERSRPMAASDRLSGLDASFLHLERGGRAHMHVAGVYVFDGPPPAYDDLVEALERRLDLVPRYRQRLAWVPYGQGRPRWVDDPYFNVRYHVRHTALP